MSASVASYVPIRDDVGLSLNERSFIRSCAFAGDSHTSVLRDDGRDIDDVRKIKLRLGRWDNGSECTVQWGHSTRVTSLCSASLVPPNQDRPSNGMLNFSVDLSPMASTGFRQAPPVSTAPAGGSRTPNYSNTHQRLLSNRILRCLERIILIGGALDTEALVVLPSKWVWRLNVAITVLDHGGNLIDACVLAAIAALRHYRKPHVELSSASSLSDNFESPSNVHGAASDEPVLPNLIPSIVKEATPLPLHHSPLSISFALIPMEDDVAVSAVSSSNTVVALVDPTDREELVQLGSLTIAMNVHSEVCLLDYGGGCELTPTKLKGCYKLAEVSVKQLCRMLESSLSEANGKANQERLVTLQRSGSMPLPPRPLEESEGVHFFQASMEQDVKMDTANQCKYQMCYYVSQCI